MQIQHILIVKRNLDIFRILTIKNSYDDTAVDGVKIVTKNLELARNLKFSEDVPVFSFVSEQNC